MVPHEQNPLLYYKYHARKINSSLDASKPRDEFIFRAWYYKWMEKFYKHFDSIDSTQSWAKDHLSSLSKEGMTLIWTEEQKSGYGQRKRVWQSPRGEGLWATLCLPCEQSVDPFVITREISQALLILLEEYRVNAAIKWPNDIVVKGKKIAGVLTEVVEGFILIGIGLNTNMPLASLTAIDQPATSLYLESGQHASSSDLLEKLSDLVLVHSKFL